MKILIDIGHPAHVHLFRNLHNRLISGGHTVYVTVKNIPIALSLLESYKIKFANLGDKPTGFLNKIVRQFFFTKQIIRLVRQNKIDIGLGVSVSIAQAGMLTPMKSIVFDDDDFKATPFYALAAHLPSNHVLTPDCVQTMNLKKIIPYAGYHELAYLHPNVFTPDPSVLNDLGVNQNERFFVLRFNAFKAHHDIGKEGLSLENKRELVTKLRQFGKVFISGEQKLEKEFQQYQLPSSSEQIHSVLYYASMLISDSQTMTSEAAVLGTPALRMNSFVGKISYLEEQEKKYALTYGFLPDNFVGLLAKIDELLAMPNLKPEWQLRREKMLGDKIDVTAFLTWFVENYPGSIGELKKDPDYTNRFK